MWVCCCSHIRKLTRIPSVIITAACIREQLDALGKAVEAEWDNLPSIVGLGIKIRYSGLSNETAYGDMLCLGPFLFIAVRLRLPPHLLLPRPLFLSLLDSHIWWRELYDSVLYCRVPTAYLLCKTFDSGVSWLIAVIIREVCHSFKLASNELYRGSVESV